MTTMEAELRMDCYAAKAQDHQIMTSCGHGTTHAFVCYSPHSAHYLGASDAFEKCSRELYIFLI